MAQAATGSWARRAALAGAGGGGDASAANQETANDLLALIQSGLSTSQGGTTWTDRSTAATVASTNKQIAAAVAAPRRVLVQNPAQELEPIFVRLGAAASISIQGTSGNSFELAPGAPPFDVVTAQSINVMVATTGHVVIAAEVTA